VEAEEQQMITNSNGDDVKLSISFKKN